MNTLARIIAAIIIGIALFWFAKLGFWLDSLTTARTPFYWTLGKVVAWASAILGGAAVLLAPAKGDS